MQKLKYRTDSFARIGYTGEACETLDAVLYGMVNYTVALIKDGERKDVVIQGLAADKTGFHGTIWVKDYDPESESLGGVGEPYTVDLSDLDELLVY